MSLPDITNYTKEEKEELFFILCQDPDIKPFLIELLKAHNLELFKNPDVKSVLRELVRELVDERISEQMKGGNKHEY